MRFTTAGVDAPGLPRILATHDDSPQVKSADKVMASKRGYRRHAVVFLVRDPRDTIVSLYFHKTRQLGEQYQGTLGDFLHEPVGSLASLVAFYNVWAEQRHVPRVFHLARYEDIHADPAGALRGVLDAVGLPGVCDEIVAGAVEATTFDRMQALEASGTAATKALVPPDPGDPESYRVRRGVVGGFSDYLDEGEVAAMNEMLRRELSPFYGYTF
jgi:hypothetical protein